MLDFLRNGAGQILTLFFADPEKEYYLREIGKHLAKEPGTFQRSIDKLVQEGILLSENRANLRYFRLNKNYPLYEELKRIISKTFGIEAKLKKLVDNLTEVECAFIFGSVAKNEEYSGSDIDLLLIGSADQDYLTNRINELETELCREINYHVYGKQELIEKLRSKNEFLTRVFSEPKLILKGNVDEFTTTY